MDSFILEIPESITWTNDDLFAFCNANRNLNIERDANGFINIMSPSGGLSSYYISVINAELVIWNRKVMRGIPFESSGGFLLKNGSMRAPDIALVSREKWNQLSKKEKEQFPPLCPEFVVEVRSATDRLPVLQVKMEEWLENGAELAWLIDPKEENVHIYRAGQEPEVLEGLDRNLSGEGLTDGFQFDLSFILED